MSRMHTTALVTVLVLASSADLSGWQARGSPAPRHAAAATRAAAAATQANPWSRPDASADSLGAAVRATAATMLSALDAVGDIGVSVARRAGEVHWSTYASGVALGRLCLALVPGRRRARPAHGCSGQTT